MPLIHSYNPRFLYSIPPKTASTSIITALKGVYPTAKVLYDKHGVHEPSEADLCYAGISVRNPFSRIVSLWQFFEHEMDFQFFLRHAYLHTFENKLWHAMPQTFWLRPHFADRAHVMKFENLQEDFSDFCSELNAISWNANPDSNIVQVPVLKHLNKTGEWTNVKGIAVKRDRPWWEYYQDGDEEIVQELYQDDFLVFKYSSSLEAAIPKN